MNPNRPITASTYRTLLHWLAANVTTEQDMLNTKIIFGPRASYFAQCNDKCTYHDLPIKLAKTLDEKRYALSDPASTPKAWIPRIIALGANDTFIALWRDGRKVTSLARSSGMLGLARQIDDDNTETVIPDDRWANIVLSNSDIDEYVAVQKDGVITWYRRGTDTSNLEILVQADMYMQMRAREDGGTFSFRQGLGEGRMRSLEIGPGSGLTVEELKGMFRSGGKETLEGLLARVKGWVGWK